MTEVLRMTITGKAVWTAPLGRAATTARPAPRLAPQSCEDAVGDWLYKIVAGIQPAAIRLTPTPGPGLDWAREPSPPDTGPSSAADSGQPTATSSTCLSASRAFAVTAGSAVAVSDIGFGTEWEVRQTGLRGRW